MEPVIIICGVIAIGVAAMSIYLASRLIPMGINAYRDTRILQNTPIAELRSKIAETERAHNNLSNPEGRKRDSSIVGFYEDCLRHKDGAYSRIYEIELDPTTLARDDTIERRTDDFARLLCELLTNEMVQIRYTVLRDPGIAIAEHLEEQNIKDHTTVHPAAAHLHALDLGHYHGLATAGAYRTERAFLVIRIPSTHKNDAQNSGLTAYLSDLFKFHDGFKGTYRMLFGARSHRAFRGVIDRLKNDEAETYRKVSQRFRHLETECPIKLNHLIGRELWNAVYSSHNLDAPAAPNVRLHPGSDLRHYLCSDTIEYYDDHIRHGNVCLKLVSLFAPPDGGITADCTRLLTTRPDLAFPHTLCVQYVGINPDDAKKDLLKRAKQVEQETQKADGRSRRDFDARKSLSDIEGVLSHIAASRDALIKCSLFAIVEGHPIKNNVNVTTSLKELDERTEKIISALKRIEGADAKCESAAATQCLYPDMLLGEMSPSPTYREMRESAYSLSALIPCEAAWRGSKNAHTTLSTVSGRLIRFNLWDKTLIKSPFCLILGEPGSGKSTYGGALITDALATQPNCKVNAVDFGESLAPLGDALGARYIRLTPDDHRTINIWDSPELAAGEMPPEETITLILMHYSLLCGIKEHDERSPVVLTKVIKSVLQNFVHKNGPDKPKKEPTVKNLVDKLQNYQFENTRDKECAEDLASKLETYINDPWLDAPTSPDFDQLSSFDIYELDTLDKFTPLIRQTLAGVIATRVIRSIGKKNELGEFEPTLLVFDEAHRYQQEFPGLMKVIARGARQGRKANVVTCVLTHTYDDFTGIHDITATAGVKIIGLQTGDFSKLAHDAQLSERTISAINAIRNKDGHYAQFVLVMGTGMNQQVEMVQVELSPIKLWIQTTNPQERNTRTRVMRMTGCSTLEAATFLAEHYPRGLIGVGLLEIDEETLKRKLQGR